MKKLSLVFLFFAIISFSRGQNNSCFNAQFIHFDTVNYSATYPAGVNTANAQTGPNYGCLATQPNPAWFYLRVINPGNVEIEMHGSNNYDIDFACWGPFDSINLPFLCNNSLTAGSPTPNHHSPGPGGGYPVPNMIDCSYDPGYQEWCYIPNALSGKYYIFMITNYSNQVQNITFFQSNLNQPGAGDFKANLTLNAATNSNAPVCESDTLKLVAPYYPNAQYKWIYPNNTGISNLANPQISNTNFLNSGVYTLEITDSNQQIHLGYLNIQIIPKPDASFVFNIFNQNVQFYNNFAFSNSNSYFWNFGDGNIDTIANPMHHFNTLGNYIVTSYLSNSCGVDTVASYINITSLGINDHLGDRILIAPNPSKSIFTILIPDKIKYTSYEVVSLDGKKIISHDNSIGQEEKKINIDLSFLPKSIYFLKLNTAEKIIILKLIKF